MIFALIFSLILTVLAAAGVYAVLAPDLSNSKRLKKKYRDIDNENEVLRLEKAKLETKIEKLETEIVARQLGLTWVKDTEE